MTFSLVGRCERTGMVGTAVSSSSPAVAARCAHARAGAGAAASQNVTDPRLGPAVLDLMAAGRTAQQAVDAALAKAAGAAYRQVTAVDESGSTGAFSGAYTLGTNAIEAAITKGEIKGDVHKNSYGDDVTITADAKAVDTFFASHDPLERPRIGRDGLRVLE